MSLTRRTFLAGTPVCAPYRASLLTGKCQSCTWYRDRWTQDRNIVLTATGLKQNLPALEQIRSRWSRG
jgi:hypothetical protein